MTRSLRAPAAFVAVLALTGTPALAWGPTGHRLIGTLAMNALPAELPAFLRARETAARIGMLAQEPDRWRNSGAAHDGARDPGHFIHVLDDGTAMGGPRLDALPATREDYDTALRAAGSNQYRAGYLPYAIVDGWQQLVDDFAYWRIDAAGERLAKTAGDRAWFAADRRLREMLTIRDLGVWSHYVGDASQPNHASVHYDDWGPGPNPEGFPLTKGLHWKFENDFVQANVTAADVVPHIGTYADCGCTIAVRTARYLGRSRTLAVTLFRLDKRHAFDGPSADGKAFAVERLADGAHELRDMIVDAWRASAGFAVGTPPVAVTDAARGDPAAFEAVRGPN